MDFSDLLGHGDYQAFTIVEKHLSVTLRENNARMHQGIAIIVSCLNFARVFASGTAAGGFSFSSGRWIDIFVFGNDRLKPGQSTAQIM